MTSTPNPDVSLSDTTPGDPDTVTALAAAAKTVDAQPAARQWTIDEILATAKTPQKRARVCLRADLEAAHAEVVAELATLVDANGEVMVDDEASAADVSRVTRARDLSARAERLEAEMAEYRWTPLFTGLSSEDFAVFQKAHYPKGKDADLTEYHNKLIAETMSEPTVTVDQVAGLRKKLGTASFAELWRTANVVCLRGGVDVPKSPSISLPDTEQ